GNPEFTILPDRAYDRIQFTPELEHAAATARCVCFGTLIQRTASSRETLHRLLDRADSALKFLDLNLRQGCYSQQTVTASMRRADILKLNAHEALEVMEMLGWSGLDLPAFCTRSLEELGLTACVISLGASGALAAARGTPGVLYSPGYQVKVLDTVGSGDAFSAGFLDAWLQGCALAECCRRGNLLGALNCARRGATGPITEQEIRALAETGAERQIFQEEYRQHLQL
ncbi:PfkB family carbohydrate kinase, partial [bacterium]|nr:PfkB family carbohydrate kinase [bacterium]